MSKFVLHPEAYADLDESGNTLQLIISMRLIAFLMKFTKQ